MRDLLRVQPRVHPLGEPVFRAIRRDFVFGLADFITQDLGALIQPGGGPADGGGLRAELILDIDVHRIVHRRGGNNRIFSGERHFHHAGKPDRRRM